jgi:hypothetical protein
MSFTPVGLAPPADDQSRLSQYADGALQVRTNGPPMHRLQLLLVAAIMLTSLSACQSSIHVATHGAVPNDGQDDRAAIAAAIQAAVQAQRKTGKPVTVRLASGTYNLTDPGGPLDAAVHLDKTNHIILEGATHADGSPATCIERNVARLGNRMQMADLVRITGGSNITLRNLVLDNKPQFATAGVCVLVDRQADAVEVDVFEGLPHFDGMDAFSANVWDLKTRALIPGVPHLSIGTNQEKFKHQWQHVPGGEGRRYRLTNMGLAKHLSKGDGVSWHFNVINSGHQLKVVGTDGLTLENILIPNGPVAVCSFHDVADLTCRRVRLEPQGNQLAVGPRDRMYIAHSRGEYVFEECHWEGVRWDPLALFNKLCFVDSVENRTIKFHWYRATDFPINGLTATLWWPDGIAEARIKTHTPGLTAIDPATGRTIRHHSIVLADDPPAGFGAGHYFVAHRRTRTVIRNSTFQNNYGRSPYISGVNMEITGNTFRNNGYAFAIGLSSPGAGGFSRNVRIANNTFVNTPWSTVYGPIPTSGAIRIYEAHPVITNASFNDSIVIENNTFKGINLRPNFAAIDVRNAQNVTIRGNTFIDTTTNVQIDPASTKQESITID